MSSLQQTQRGLSLIELMISITIGLIVSSALGYIYLGARQTYKNQDALARVQENGRYATELLSRELRNVGFVGCAGLTGSMTVPTSAAAGCQLSTSNTTCNSLNTPSSYNVNYGEQIQGFNAAGTEWNPALDASLAGMSIIAGNDVLTIRTAENTTYEVIAHPGGNPPGSSDIKLNTTSGLSSDEIVMVSDCSYSAVFQITNINAGNNVVHNTGGSSLPGNFSKGLGKTFVGGTLFKISTKSFFIRNGAGNLPSLWIYNHNQAAGGNNPQELVEGVESMQILYGVDTDGDRDIDQYTTADAVANWSQVRSVRVRLLMVSPDNGVTDQAQSYLWDSDGDGDLETVTAADRRLRYVFSTTVGLRNRLP